MEVPRACAPKLSEVLPLMESVAVGICPAPLSATVCGEPVALSVMVSTAERVPAALGEKVRYTKQRELGVTGLVQPLLAMLKSAALAPEIASDVMCTAVLPVFCIKRSEALLVAPTFCDPKEMAGGILSVSIGPCPVPLSATVCGDPAALSAKFS